MQKNKLEIGKSLGKFVIRGEGSLRFWEGLASGLSLASSFFILTALTLQQFGLYQLVLAFVNIVAILNIKTFDAAISVELRRYFNKDKLAHAKRIFKEYAAIKIVLSLFLVAGIFFGSDFIAIKYGADIGLFIKIISGLLLIETLFGLERMFFKSIFSFAYFKAPAIREGVKFLILGGYFFFGDLGVADVLSIHIIGWAAALLFVSFSFIRSYREVFSTVKPIGKFIVGGVIKAYGVWLFLRYAFGQLTKNITPWLIKFFVGIEAVALYSLAVNLVAFILELFPINMLSWVFLMKMDKKSELRYIFSRSLKYVIWFSLILFVGGIVFVPIVINLILPKYNIAMSLFMVMLLSLPIYGFYKLLKSILNVFREYKILTIRNVIEGGVMILVLTILLPIIGIMGAAISYVAIYIARIAYVYPAAVKTHPYLKIRFRDFLIFDKHDKDFLLTMGKRAKGMAISSLSKIRKND